jgi:hypothetical protein
VTAYADVDVPPAFVYRPQDKLLRSSSSQVLEREGDILTDRKSDGSKTSGRHMPSHDRLHQCSRTCMPRFDVSIKVSATQSVSERSAAVYVQ